MRGTDRFDTVDYTVTPIIRDADPAEFFSLFGVRSRFPVVTGGPVEYSGEDMATVHEGMGITEEEFNAIATHLDDVLETFDVPADEREMVLEEIASYEGAIVGA